MQNGRVSLRVVWFTGSIALIAPLVGCVDPSASADLDRVTLVNVPLSVVGGQPLTSGRQPLAPLPTATFAYVASVAPPMASTVTVQATNFAIANNYGFVVYNDAGAAIAGGLDVLDLRDPKAPQLIASLVDTTAEFADVAADRGYVYAVGADGEGGILRVWDVHAATDPTVAATLHFDARYGTSLALDHDIAYVTLGTDGGLATVDVSDPTHPTLVRATPAANALYVVHKGANNLVLFGDSSLQLEGERDGAVWPLPTLAATPVAAPGRMVVNGDRAFVNAGTTGLTTLKITGDGDSAAITNHVDLDGTGNGIDASEKTLFLAQGEAGLQAYAFNPATNASPPTYLGRLEFPGIPASTNQVRWGATTGCKDLLIGTGLGGFRIVSFTE